MSEQQAGASGAGQDQGAAGAGAGQGAGGGAAWDAGFSADLRGALAPKGFKSHEDLGRAYVELEKKFGADKLALPPKDAKPEDWMKWDGWNKLGRPDKPEGYEIARPADLPAEAWDEKNMAKWAGRFHGLGIPKLQAQGLVAAMMADVGEFMKGQETSRADTLKATETALRKEWGDAYDGRMDLANRLLRDKAPSAIAALQASGLANNLELVKLLAEVADRYAEDGTLPGGKGGGRLAMTPKEAVAEIAKLKGDEAFAKKFLDAQHPENAQAKQRIAELSRIARGT